MSSSSKHVTVSLNVHKNNNEETKMSQITKTARTIMLLAAGTVASVLIAGSLATTAKAETVYFGYEVSFREAKQMCNGQHGRIFETERAQYACTGDLRERKYKRPNSVPRKANARPGKLQNFTGRKDFSNIGKTGGEGGANGGGGNGGGTGGQK